MRLRTALLALAIALTGASAPAQPPPDNKETPIDLYRNARDRISAGNYDLAMQQLEKFLAATPKDADYLELQKRFGTTTFLQLRNVLKWSENADAQKKGQDVVEKIIVAAELANKKVNQDPNTIRKFVNNLIAKTREERIYARQQLYLAGDAIVPILVETLRTSSNPQHQAEILAYIPTLNDSTVPSFLAAIEGMPGNVQPALLNAIASRRDVLDLVARAETDFTPHLWYYSSSPDDSGLKRAAGEILVSLTAGNSLRKRPEAELTRLARPFVYGKGEFRTLDKVGNKVTVTTWDSKTLKLKADVVTPSRAAEYFGLRNLRWAIERKPDFLEAQELFVQLSTERAVERAKFGDLAQSEPQVYALLATVPSSQLLTLLEVGIAERRTALVLGMLQALSDRAHQEPAVEAKIPQKMPKPTPVVRALQYPDPRVQFAAAVAILRSPGDATHGESARIIEILRRALEGEIDPPAKDKIGRVLITDPNPERGNGLANAFRDAGFHAERFATSREMLQRIAKSADYDAIVVDSHAVSPQLPDLLSHLAADPNAARRPTLLVASSNKVPGVTLERLVLRLALLVAATETLDTRIPPPPVLTSTDTKIQVVDDKGNEITVSVPSYRDGRFVELFEARTARLQRLVRSADIPLTEKLQTLLELRRDQYTLAAIAAEFDVTARSAPNTFLKWKASTEQILKRTDLAGESERVQPSSMEHLILLMDKLEEQLGDDQRKLFEKLRLKVQRQQLGLALDSTRDYELEKPLIKIAKPFAFVTVIPETLNPETLANDVRNAAADPSQLARDPAERAATAKEAVQWLRKIAIGEVTGYEVKPASSALLGSLSSDLFAPSAIDAVARLASADAQRELVELACDTRRTVELRLQASEAAIRHVQEFGKLTSATLAEKAKLLADVEKDLAIRSKLRVLSQQVAVVPAKVSDVIRDFNLAPAPAAPAPKPKEPAPMPKEPEVPK